MTVTESADTTEPEAAPPDPPRRGLSGLQIGVLVAALAFLGGAIGYAVGDGQANADPFNAVDVGFMQDMGYHHDQATELSIILLDKDGVDPDLKAFAQEIIVGQRYEQGVYSALLDRWGHSSDPGDTVMGWMGEEQPTETMDGLATPEQIDALIAAEGDEAEALWIALMSEHHLAGLHMADYEARYGQDRTVVNLAEATVRNQRSEVLDIARYRTNAGLPIPEGFTDPTEDQRLNPISFTDPAD
ncbi:MAG: DUF305 domain-containing protein [Acidimicrobiales bacterium]|nr:DUF305 domain-containing protein [Acidimicrobiales bacterium]